MNAFVTILITLMPFFAMLPLAIGAVVVVALIASPRVRESFADWIRRRLRLDPRPEPAVRPGAVEELHRDIARLEERLGFLERVITESPRLREGRARPASDAAASLVEGNGESQ